MDTVRTEYVTLHVADGTTMNSCVAAPAGGGKLPGLLVFQEAFGVNPHIRDVTQRFAKAGYVAIAPELFHRTGPGFEGDYNNFQACMPHMQALTPDGLTQDAQAAFDWLQKNPRVLPNRTASVGFCMGGRVSFLANSVLPLQAAISFYGGGIAPALLAARASNSCSDAFLLGRLGQPHPAGADSRCDRRDAASEENVRECRILGRGSRILLRRSRELQGNSGKAGVGPLTKISRHVRQELNRNRRESIPCPASRLGWCKSKEELESVSRAPDAA